MTTDIYLNKSNFQKKIVQVWQDQKEDETYNFIFEDEESEQMFNDLENRFSHCISDT